MTCLRKRFASFLAAACLALAGTAVAAPESSAVDDAKLAAAGIRKLTSKRLVLYTDLADNYEVRRLPDWFDQAFPLWCRFFGVDPARHADWRMTGCIMKQKSRFERAGLLPDDLPPFPNGYSRGHMLWVFEQESEYYRRHLLLHEGTHGFMNTVLGGCGPPWLAEGLAELLGTHRVAEGKLTLGVTPASREEVPIWGRIRIIKEGYAARRAMSIRGIMNYPPTAHREKEPYAWCWALTTFLERDTRYHDRFHQLFQSIGRDDVNDRFHSLYDRDFTELNAQWQVFIAGVEYGYDFPRAAIQFAPGKPLASDGAAVRVAADRGWQSSRIRLEAGKSYRLTASGRYQVARQPRVWWSEPGGVSIRYYQGHPLGMLLAAVEPDVPAAGVASPLLRPVAAGLEATITPERTGTLYLRINHSMAELQNVAGELKVEVALQTGD